MINKLPEQITSMPPVVNGLVQYQVEIMDQSGHHGTYDTRYRPNGKSFTGLGIGYIRIYTDIEGNLAGYTWSLADNSKFISINTHPFVIGRLI